MVMDDFEKDFDVFRRKVREFGETQLATTPGNAELACLCIVFAMDTLASMGCTDWQISDTFTETMRARISGKTPAAYTNRYAYKGGSVSTVEGQSRRRNLL